MSAYHNPALTQLVKAHLRIAPETTAMDEEVNGLIAAALADMTLRGVDAATACPETAVTAGDMKPLAVRAVVYYCKANFGIAPDPNESAQYWTRYDGLTQGMSHTAAYRSAPAVDGAAG